MKFYSLIPKKIYDLWEIGLILFTDYGVTSYDIGTGFGHFAIASQDVSIILHYLSKSIILHCRVTFIWFMFYAWPELLGLQIGWRHPG